MPDLPFDLRQSEREREREEEELKEDRGEGEKNGNGGEKAEFRLFRKLIIRPPNSFLEYFQFLSLSLSLTRSRELDESFFLCRDTLLNFIVREEGEDTKISPSVWRRVIDASYARYI